MVSRDQRETNHASRNLGWRAVRPNIGRGSEDDLATELNNTSRVSGLNFTEAWTIRVIPHRRPNSGAGEGVESVLGVIEDIKRLNPELECDLFCKPEILPQAHVPVVEARLLNGIAARVADDTDAIALRIARKVERGWIEIVVRAGPRRELIARVKRLLRKPSA